MMWNRSPTWLYTAWFVAILFIHHQVKSAPLQGPNVTNIRPVNSTSLEITWDMLPEDDANGNITGYMICYNTTTFSNVTCPKSMTTGNVTSYNLTGLNEATTYYVRVKANNGTNAGFGPLGNLRSGTTLEDKPAKGPNAMLEFVNSTSIRVNWNTLSKDDANGVITRYEVCYEVGTDVSNCTKNITTVITSGTIMGLKPATPYAIAIRASTAVGFGPLGAILSVTTNESEPAKGPNAMLEFVNSTSIRVNWNALNEDDANGVITRYEVCYEVGTVVSSCTKNVTSSTTSGTIMDLKPATQYAIAVRASTAVGFGPLGRNITVKTNDSAPAKGATVIEVRPESSTSLEVTWLKLEANDTNGNITGYMICYDKNPFSNGTCLFSQEILGEDDTSDTLSGLDEATKYFVAVKAGTIAGFGPLGNLVSNTTLEDKPSKGPNVTINSNTSTSIEVSWQPLNSDDANGKITKYAVCYELFKENESSIDKCNETRVVHSFNITNLKKFTKYRIAVKASTKIGFGPLGNNIVVSTDEDAPDRPENIQLTSDFTVIRVSWTKPSVPNGVIRKYKYCRNGLSGCGTTTGDITSATITGVSPGTEYNITVQAFTIVGGQINSKVVNTTKSGFEAQENMMFETIGVSDSKTQIGFKLPVLNSSEVDLIKSLHVFVKRWLSDDSERTFQSSSSRTFENSNNGMMAYVALEMNRYVNGENIIVGKGNMSSSARRKRRSTVTYLNAPLLEDTDYGIFVRVFYDDQQSISQNSDVLRRTTGKDDENNTAVIVIVVIICILVLVIAIVGLLLLKRRKSRTIYRDIVLEPVAPVKPIVRYPIPIDEFRQHCNMLDENAGLEYQEEYENIRNGVLTAEIGKRPENIDKNRYNNIHAYDDSRVILSEIDGEEGSDYINANHIDGYERKNQFIAAQGTLKNTIVDFWRMIWEQNVSSIVMLANPIEKGREKLAIYWPQDKAVKHGPFLIKLDGEVELADYVIRKMTITKDDVKEIRQMTQFHYTVWPDHGVPQYTTSLQAFLTRVRKFTRNDENPLVVHCSAGVGRTGTFIGIFAMLDMIEKTKTVDIFNYVCQMRKQRTHMVQVESQYVFLHKAVLEAIECGDTEINAPDLRVKLIQLSRTDPNNPEQTLMEKQFKVLQQYTFVKSNTEEAKKSFNADKNRNKAILPYEDTRVSLLKSPGVDGSDYINAGFIDSYQVRGMYIATQFPLENTVNEFWRMVWEKKCNCIVMLANIDENPTSFQKYWTDKTNDALLCGNLLVSIENEENADEFVIRNFKLKKNDGGETRDIWHFHFLSWNENELPRSPVGLIQMIGRIQDVQRQCGNNPIVVHCSDGGGRTGAFCALVTSLERVKQDQSFNLFQTIMLERIQRPRMVSSIEQYQFCFQAILQFLQSFDEYANFKEIQNSS